MEDDQAATEIDEPGAADLPSLSIRADIAPRITFATHQCDVALVTDLVVSNPLDTDLEDLTLHIFAEPKIVGARTWRIDRLSSGSEFRPRDRRVPIEGGLLDALTERMRAEIFFELRQGDTVLAESRYPIIALARNEWGGAQFMPELLAAFVTPNDPAVQRLLKEASQHLERVGKNGALEGYQAKSRKRSWELVSGIWAAMSVRGITYAEPPASFGRQGQKIRLPSMVEEQGLATCLDTALFFAAAIEQVGLYPLIVFTGSHALAGAWLQPQSLPSLTVDDPMEIRKAIAQDEMILFETTMATGGHAMPFSRALAEGKRQVDEEHEKEFIYAIDIRQARGRDIQPLSSIVSPDQGNGAVADISRSAPPMDEAPNLPPFDVDVPVNEEPQTPAERLDRWKLSLLDLSKRNRLLNLRPSESAISIFCPDPALLKDKLADGKRISLIAPPVRKNANGEPDATLYHLRTGDDFATKFAQEALERNEVVANLEQKPLEKGTIELYRKAKADFEEGGSNTLFLALGMLRWSAPGDTKHSSRAPLILLPVKLIRSSAASKPNLTSHEDDPVFNYTLLQMLRQDFGIDLSVFAAALPQDDHGINVKQVWDTVRARIRDVPGFEVVEDVVLSTFSFAKYLMWKDLTDRTETLKSSPFVRHVIDTPRDSYKSGASFLDPWEVDSAIDPSELMAPLNADSSQIVAIHASGKQGDFVLEGPPGTGKSETIGNIIAHNIGLGRRVLFVSEKMAALEVVYRRLRSCGLGDFCLELHSSKASKRAVLDQLSAAWEKRAAHSPDEWTKKATQLGEVRTKLNGLVGALHAPGPGGLSPRDAIGRSLRYGDVHRLRLDWLRDESGQGRASDRNALAALEALAKRLGMQFSQLDLDDINTFKAIAHSEWSYGWAADIVQAAAGLRDALEALVRRRQAFSRQIGLTDAGEDLAETKSFVELAAVVPECANQNLRFAFGPDGREVISTLEKALAELTDYHARAAALPTSYPLDALSAPQIQGWLAERAVANVKVWPMKPLARRKLRKAIWTALRIGKGLAPKPEADLELLLPLAEQRQVIVTFSKLLPESSTWKGLETDVDLAMRALLAGRRLRYTANTIANFGRKLVETHDLLSGVLTDGRDSLNAGMPTAVAAEALRKAYEVFENQLANFHTISGESSSADTDGVTLGMLARTATGVIARERRLNLWCAWVGASRDAREAGLGTLVDALEEGTVRHDETVEAFRTAYAIWLAPILIDARPELRSFSAVLHDDLIQTFRTLDKEHCALTATYIRAKLSGSVPIRDSQEADPGYGVLSRELQKKARIKPVRQLVAEMGEALTTLTPCLLMSPLSVAQFLPAEIQPFDLVVFDEASQITVPDAIGAIARGKRCIVVGDPKQMPPTRFFERGADEEENEEARDLESILDEALAARVPHHRLTGHYRSRHESLICFSNHAYYQGSLVTYPSAETRESAVTLRRVPGVYAKGKSRTNEIEAKAVVAEVVRRLRDPLLNGLSIGVVTLNSEQQRLVEDLLDQERRSDPELERYFAQSAEFPVFVKNLETVQGDERDVILLSVGYGPTDPSAKTMSINFGPLNRQGGERRLNVAITRATTEVVVFASFDASMVDLTRTSSEAVKDLKNYIDYAARGPVALGEALQSMGGSTGYDSDFEMAVAERLRQCGWTVRTQIGVSKFRIDLGIVHPDAPGKFLAGIECDGATYHSSPSARDRDRVRHIVLENLGWRLLRVWSTAYFLEPDAAVRRLDEGLRLFLDGDRAAIETEVDTQANAITTVSSAPASQATNSRGAHDLDDDAEPRERKETSGRQLGSRFGQPDEGLRVASLFQAPTTTTPTEVDSAPETGQTCESPRASFDGVSFHDPAYRPRLRAIATTIIDTEGPITFKRLSDRIARAHGFKRTGHQISSTVWAACNRIRPNTATPDGHKIFWPESMEPVGELQFRGFLLEGESREWREVPYPEKVWLVKSIAATGHDDLSRAVAEAIGIGRVTTQFREEISGIFDTTMNK